MNVYVLSSWRFLYYVIINLTPASHTCELAIISKPFPCCSCLIQPVLNGLEIFCVFLVFLNNVATRVTADNFGAETCKPIVQPNLTSEPSASLPIGDGSYYRILSSHGRQEESKLFTSFSGVFRPKSAALEAPSLFKLRSAAHPCGVPSPIPRVSGCSLGSLLSIKYTKSLFLLKKACYFGRPAPPC
ncbi:uncharacterized protein EV420DRAFT_162333 [Desarmillaria tabescens]|uniref:Uncharacterized protein n=1 Tax=Armillaria tabescens TaxID=1929756 RepID=A0AA39MJW9_ARMTA|nr:uncharacterized protein EV420DRAFT_162333 [Desarmillaria tabescens]KAK0437611.1 hypothetical protein EV420DRAFT_162333 [Desarmillaria tabescens]